MYLESLMDAEKAIMFATTEKEEGKMFYLQIKSNISQAWQECLSNFLQELIADWKLDRIEIFIYSSPDTATVDM